MKLILLDILIAIRHSEEYHELKKFVIKYLINCIRNIALLYTNKYTDAVIDVVDNRDYTFEEMVGAEKYPESFDESFRLSKFQNQRDWSSIWGNVWCWPTSSSMGADIAGAEELEEWGDGKYIAESLKDRGRLHSFGTYMGDNPRILKELNIISAFYKVKTIEQAKTALSMGNPILIGYNKLKDINGTLTPRNATWHLIVCLPKYNEKGVYCANPWTGKETFLSWDLWGHLFNSKYVLETNKDLMQVDKLKKVLRQYKNMGKYEGDRLKIYDYLRLQWYKKNLILIAMRRVYWMNKINRMSL